MGFSLLVSLWSVHWKKQRGKTCLITRLYIDLIMTRHVIARRFRNGRRERRVAAISKWGESAEKLIEQKEKIWFEYLWRFFKAPAGAGITRWWRLISPPRPLDRDGDGSASERFISSLSSSHEYRERNLPSWARNLGVSLRLFSCRA